MMPFSPETLFLNSSMESLYLAVMSWCIGAVSDVENAFSLALIGELNTDFASLIGSDSLDRKGSGTDDMPQEVSGVGRGASVVDSAETPSGVIINGTGKPESFLGILNLGEVELDFRSRVAERIAQVLSLDLALWRD